MYRGEIENENYEKKDFAYCLGAYHDAGYRGGNNDHDDEECFDLSM